MNDRYLYRAKRTDNGEWVKGHYLFCCIRCENKSELENDTYKHWIVTNNGEIYEVDKSTICQCTGLKDKNGNLIWENDILNRCNIVVKWKEELASYCLTKKGWMYQHFFGEAVDACDCEVVGNIFDNPELLETGKEAGKHGNQDILMPAT